MNAGAICDGGDRFEVRRISLCPTENRVRRFYVYFQAWYGGTWTCLGCGDSWADGERASRPFQRGWRKEAITRATEHWNHVTVTARNRKQAFREWMDAELGDVA